MSKRALLIFSGSVLFSFIICYIIALCHPRAIYDGFVDLSAFSDWLIMGTMFLTAVGIFPLSIMYFGVEEKNLKRERT